MLLYLSQIDRLKKAALRFVYIQYVTSIKQIVKDRDLRLWSSIVDNSLHPLQDLLLLRRSTSQVSKRRGLRNALLIDAASTFK